MLIELKDLTTLDRSKELKPTSFANLKKVEILMSDPHYEDIVEIYKNEKLHAKRLLSMLITIGSADMILRRKDGNASTLHKNHSLKIHDDGFLVKVTNQDGTFTGILSLK